ncbi:MAG: dTDP-4-dehydrorhamnose reductase [Desulfobacterales bacterium CG23_combo_of_CG06-09_8_20_14_all_51_8]|nr:MAG: dTDP-4-dehydrorhamnose reductase [Desulfobacterales bacterium CG23_combo_of_CG06-09_8_20_14_all_51_8]
MNILITGANGQLGKDCTQMLGDVHATTCVDIEELDITHKDQVLSFIRKIRPDLIINCAAFTQVDLCETQKDLAWAVNVTGAENLALAADACGARLVHISTDYVFDGKKQFPDAYSETDTPNPLSYYGITKREGELAIMRATDNHLILRTAWLYGFYGANFIKTIVKKALAAPDTPLKIVNDQFGSPTWSMILARQIAALVQTPARGLYHASAEGACTWFEFARYFLEKLQVPHQIIPCTTRDYPTPAVRPGCSILENQRLKAENCNQMGRWQTDLDEFLQVYGKQLLDQCQPSPKPQDPP